MHSKEPKRNRLAKVLPAEFREQLASAGVPRRKYTAIVRATCSDGRVFSEMIVEEGWIVGLDRSALVGSEPRPIPIDPRELVSIELVQYI